MEKRPRVEAVVINYKRTDNIPIIIEALRNSSEKCIITICDVAQTGYTLSKEVENLADKVFKLSKNYGCFNRFIPAFGIDAEFSYFHDDDMLPGPLAISNLLKCVDSLPRMGVLGQMGRKFADWKINKVYVHRDKELPIIVDNVIRGYFLKTASLEHLFRFYHNHREKITALSDGRLLHDDLLLSLSMRKAKLYNYISMDNCGEDGLINKRELPDQFAIWRRPNHSIERQNILTWFKDTYPDYNRYD